jgi:RNA polymerase sigma-70 factor (ECF subfamily)
MSEVGPIAVSGDACLELLWRTAAGDEAAANELLEAVRPLVRNEVRKLYGQQRLEQGDASDVTQKYLLELWRHAATFRGKSGAELVSWIRSGARNEFLDAVRHARQQKRDSRREEPLPQDSRCDVPLAATESTASQRAIRREEEELREQALNRLSPEHQQVLQLRFACQMAWTEIASVMDRTELAVKRLYYRAVTRWKQEMGVNNGP